MSFEQYRDREIRFYQDRLAQLQNENRLLKSHSCFHHPPQQPLSPDHSHHYHHYFQPLNNSILQLNAKNERLQREAELYQRQIKRELTQFIRESNLLHECSFKRKYVNALTYPPLKHKSFRR